MPKDVSRHGFSLIELSVVLAILGLMIGGVMFGRSLIRNSELRNAINEKNNYTAAVKLFKERYNAIPGDMRNATSFWGKDNTKCPADSGNASDTGTCNGNHNGILNNSSAASATGEMFQLWRQLALAGLISGSFSGIAGADSDWNVVFGTNTPKSRLSEAGWFYYNFSDSTGGPSFAGNARTYAYDYGNLLMLTMQLTSFTDNGGVMTPEEAWNIDKKVDDGSPGSGEIIAYSWNFCATATSQTDRTGTYALTSTDKVCSLIFANQL